MYLLLVAFGLVLIVHSLLLTNIMSKNAKLTMQLEKMNNKKRRHKKNKKKESM